METIPVKSVYEFIKLMVSHPKGEICIHNASLTLIAIMEKNGYVLSDKEIKLVESLCECSNGDYTSMEILSGLISECE